MVLVLSVFDFFAESDATRRRGLPGDRRCIAGTSSAIWSSANSGDDGGPPFPSPGKNDGENSAEDGGVANKFRLVSPLDEEEDSDNDGARALRTPDAAVGCSSSVRAIVESARSPAQSCPARR